MSWILNPLLLKWKSYLLSLSSLKSVIADLPLARFSIFLTLTAVLLNKPFSACIRGVFPTVLRLIPSYVTLRHQPPPWDRQDIKPKPTYIKAGICISIISTNWFSKVGSRIRLLWLQVPASSEAMWLCIYLWYHPSQLEPVAQDPMKCSVAGKSCWVKAK